MVYIRIRHGLYKDLYKGLRSILHSLYIDSKECIRNIHNELGYQTETMKGKHVSLYDWSLDVALPLNFTPKNFSSLRP